MCRCWTSDAFVDVDEDGYRGYRKSGNVGVAVGLDVRRSTLTFDAAVAVGLDVGSWELEVGRRTMEDVGVAVPMKLWVDVAVCNERTQ